MRAELELPIQDVIEAVHGDHPWAPPSTQTASLDRHLSMGWARDGFRWAGCTSRLFTDHQSRSARAGSKKARYAGEYVEIPSTGVTALATASGANLLGCCVRQIGGAEKTVLASPAMNARLLIQSPRLRGRGRGWAR